MKIVITTCPLCGSDQITVLESADNFRLLEEEHVVQSTATLHCNNCGAEAEVNEFWKDAKRVELEAEAEKAETIADEIVAMLSGLTGTL